MPELTHNIIPLKVGVAINIDEISVVRKLECDIIQITMRNGKNEYVLMTDIFPYAAKFFNSILLEKLHA